MTRRTVWAVTGGAVAAAVVVSVVVLVTRDDAASIPDAAEERGPVHIHGLGIDPKDSSLYIATHTGMWRVERGESEPTPVGESRQDTMGFTIAGPGHFLGSGHPDNFEQPPLLGLIESRDSGATWKPISLLGEADFHALRTVANRIYGYDVSNARLMISRDGGKTWTERKTTAPVLDLVPDPTSPDRLLATTEAGLLTSADAGATWNKLGRAVGLLGWPTRNRLYLVTGDGDVLLSANGGRSWTRVGAVGGQPAAFLAHTSRRLYAAIHGGPIVQSRDGGRSWRAVTS
jgi:BNR/Asp-box repeat